MLSLVTASQTPLESKKNWRGLLLLSALLLCLSVGCQSEGGAQKTTLFDDDHEVPAHWPADVADLRQKILVRLEKLSDHGTSTVDAGASQELYDLVDWTPEVAADSNLTEAQWLPLHQAAQSIREKHRTSGWTEPLLQETSRLCELLGVAEEQLVQATSKEPNS